ncbi:MAG: T9SS type A sorting domain-containing protein [Saprospiraceae bacterium]|nr:T9SS type A sorting domain-containing protein [Saprospiraceae bacterium]
MKKILLFTALVYIATLTTFAQSLSLSDDHGNPIANGDTIELWGDINTNAMAIDIDVKNNGTSVSYTRVKKREVSLISGSVNYFCWASCYNANTILAPDTIILQPNESTSNFSGDYEPWGHAGTTTVAYIFFNATQPTDTVFVVVEYHITGVGFQENNFDLIKFSNAYPNPAKTFTTFDYFFPTSVNNVRIEILDILGTVVREVKLIGGKGVYRMETADLNEGIYFYSVIVDEQLYTTKKLVIRK